jgi:dCMP deaminase
MCRSLHAEENALMNLLKNSSSVYNDTTLYTTTFPCNLCANKIAEVGIKKVIYAEPYPQEEAKKVLNNNQIACEMFEGVKSAAFFKFFD